MTLKDNRQSLNVLVTLKLLVAAVVLVLVSGVITYFYSFNNEYSRAEQLLTQIFLTVKNNAAIAAYVNNKELAQEVVNGLAESDLVANAELKVAGGLVVASVNKKKLHAEDVKIFKLIAPFSSEHVGDMSIYINRDYITAVAKKSMMDFLFWQTLLVCSLLAASLVIVARIVTRPITSVASQLHHVIVDDDSQVTCPKGHEHNEIGMLAADINDMLFVARKAYEKEAFSRREIEKLEVRFRMIFENSNAGILLVDEKNRLIMANPAFFELFDLNAEMMNDEQFVLASLFHKAEYFLEKITRVREQGVNLSCDFKVNEAISLEAWVRCVLSRIDNFENGIVEGVFYDISDRAKLEKEYNYRATHDPLTGLLNRHGAEQCLTKALSEAIIDGKLFAVFLFDLNDFKPINDQYGHEAGDCVLVEVANRLKTLLRSKDDVVRWGGDEFVLGFIADNKEAVESIANKVMDVFDTPVIINDQLACKVGASVGISLYPDHGMDLNELIDRADTAMYSVKNSGKRGFCFYQDEMAG